MTQHDALWVSRRTTGVDEGAALTGSLLLDVRLDRAILDVLAKFKELAEGVHALIFL